MAAFTGFPAVAQYRIVIENEILLVTAGAGTTTWTVTRGAEGTTAAAHTDGTLVTHVLTMGGLEGICGQTVISDVFANLPSAGVVGKLYLPTDGVHLLRDNGSVWVPWGRSVEMTVPPTSASLTQVNVTTATMVDHAGSRFLNAPSIAATHAELWLQTLVAGAYTWIVNLETWLVSSTFTACGLALRDSAGGKLITFEYNIFSGAFNLNVVQWSDANTRVANASANTILGNKYPWLKIHDDGTTNRTYSVSYDGINWYDLFTEGRTAYLGVAPNQAGVFACANGSTVALGVYSWAGI